ncbi:MAG: hypothetical protein LBB55_05260 [Zoogloeaceae bacterium]|jgi:ketosteroid isomerase-like protein|nr:hypothetical protein [Zoogloeaceae bacterium]
MRIPATDHGLQTTKRAARAFCLLSSVLCLLFLPGCAGETPEAALARATGELQSALESKDSARVLDILHTDFVARAPDENRDWARRTMLLMFTRYKNISILTMSLDNRIDARSPDRATSEGEVALMGAEGLIPENASRYHVRLGWAKEGGEWKLIRLDFSSQ